MSRQSIIAVVVLAVIIVAVTSFFYWKHTTDTMAYEAMVQTEWLGLDGSLAGLDSSVATKSSDFIDIQKKSDELKSLADKLVSKFQQLKPPGSYGNFHANFLSYLGKTSEILALLSDNCIVWSGTKLAGFEREATNCRSLCQDCINSWPGRRALSYKPDLFVQVPAAFNAMRKERKKATSIGSGTTVVLLPGIVSAPGSFVMPTDPYIASYVSNMRSILARYRSLRSGLGAFIEKVKGDAPGTSIPGYIWTSACHDPVFCSQLQARRDIFTAIDSINPPAAYSSTHNSIRQGVENAIKAMEELQRSGDYYLMKVASDDNKTLMAEMKKYGL